MSLVPKLFMYLSIILFIATTFLIIVKVLRELELINFSISFKPYVKKHWESKYSIYYKLGFLCIFTRLFIFIISYLSYMLVKNEHLDFFSSYTILYNRWDANHYLNIAQNWYVNYGDSKYLIVFFPLYPILIKLTSLVFSDTVLSSLLVSNTCLILSAIYLYKITLLDYDSDTAFRAVKYMLVFPVSFFLGITYSESLFIFLCLGCFYYCRKNKWYVASAFAFFAALTRSMGILLVFPMIIELWLQIKDEGLDKSSSKLVKNNVSYMIKEYIMFTLKPRFLLLFTPFLGLLTYMLINYSVTGSFTKFLQYQEEHWNQKFGLFYKNIEMFTNNIWSWDPSDSASLWIPQLFIIFVVLILIIYSVPKLRSSYLIYMTVFFLMAVSPTWLLSAPRYFLSLFPIYISLGTLGRSKTMDTTITFISLMGLCFCTIAFILGYSLM